MVNKNEQLWVMIAGPYSSGAKTHEERVANLKLLNKVALQVFEKGHIPVIGVNNALPLIEIAGEENLERIMMSLSLALAERCDCCLRVGGPSKGADEEVERFKARGKQVFLTLETLPSATPDSAGNLGKPTPVPASAHLSNLIE